MNTRIKKFFIILLVIFIVVALIQLIFFSVNLNKPSITNHSDVTSVEDSNK